MLSDAYRTFFTALNDQGILWCSWKSNQHIAAGLSGDTDMDLLFRTGDRHTVENVLRESGFVIFSSPFHRSYPGVIDAISIDCMTGHVFHAHCHFLLTLGEKHLKGYILPWSDVILRSRVRLEGDGIVFTASPEHETVLLLTRYALRRRWRDRFKEDRGMGDFKTELSWLLQRTTVDRAAAAAEELLDPESAEIIRESRIGPLDDRIFKALSSSIKNIAEEKGWSRFHGFERAVTRIWREGLWYLGRFSEKTGWRLPPPWQLRRRMLPGRGVVVAFLGADGSGKSTITNALAAEWSKKINVERVYFGTGDGARGVFYAMLSMASTVYRFIGKARKNEERSEQLNDVPAGHSYGIFARAVVSLLTKKRLMRHVRHWKKMGYVVFCDRFPQESIPGMNDGPMLAQFIDDEDGFKCGMARWERGRYRELCRSFYPDVVVRLLPSFDAVLRRKPENPGVVARKMEAIRGLVFPPSCEDIVIEGDFTLPETLEKVRRALWEHIRELPVPRVRLYEPVGLPGAGKTTLARYVLGAGESFLPLDVLFPQGRGMFFRSRKVGLLLRSFFSNPLAWISIASLVVRFRLWKKPYSLWHLVRMPVQAEVMRRAPRDRSIFSEQFLLQNLWSVFVSAGVRRLSPSDISPLIAALYDGIDVSVLSLRIAPDQAALRVGGRKDGHSRFDAMEKDFIFAEISKYSDLMDDIVRGALYAGLKIEELPADDVQSAVALIDGLSQKTEPPTNDRRTEAA